MARKFELKTVPIIKGDGEVLDYRDTLMMILRTPSDPQRGIDYEEMSKRISLINKIRDAGEYVLLEESDWCEVRDTFLAHRFGRVFESVVQLGDDILAAETIKIEAVKSGTA